MKLLSIASWIAAIASIMFLIGYLVSYNEQQLSLATDDSVKYAVSDINSETLLNEHNKIRKEHGLPELKLNESLNRSAQRKADIMLESNCWSHYCPVEPWYLFIEEGYNAQVDDLNDKMGENLSKGNFTTKDTLSAWMNSPAHSQNILNERYQDIGFGYVIGEFQGFKNNMIVVAHFGVHN